MWQNLVTESRKPCWPAVISGETAWSIDILGVSASTYVSINEIFVRRGCPSGLDILGKCHQIYKPKEYCLQHAVWACKLQLSQTNFWKAWVLLKSCFRNLASYVGRKVHALFCSGPGLPGGARSHSSCPHGICQLWKPGNTIIHLDQMGLGFPWYR